MTPIRLRTSCYAISAVLVVLGLIGPLLGGTLLGVLMPAGLLVWWLAGKISLEKSGGGEAA